ncbi:MAG: type II toxin-antitoxin system HicB family antitoxin [Nostoc sp. CreGUA01]|nr:2-oxoisovalerate dehydrogenase E1 subunit beta [Nostoc sp. CreGUA01]
MTEIVFLVEDDPDGGYTARALTESIFTQADDMETLREMVRDAVHCHFPNEQNLRLKILLKSIPSPFFRRLG